jgi:hypothetical protein
MKTLATLLLALIAGPALAQTLPNPTFVPAWDNQGNLGAIINSECSFTQGETGSVARNCNAKMADTVTVEDFATSGMATDATLSFQAAATALCARSPAGGEIKLLRRKPTTLREPPLSRRAARSLGQDKAGTILPQRARSFILLALHHRCSV